MTSGLWLVGGFAAMGRAAPLSELARAPAGQHEVAVLPVAEPLVPLLPWGGLRRGSTVSVRGSTSLLLALLAAASGDGSWCAVVGLPGLGALAAAEAGVAMSRLALVPEPGSQLPGVVAVLVDALDLVALAGTRRLSAGDRQRLAGRARQRGAVLLPLGGWPGADVELTCLPGTWRGPASGGGRLREREVVVRARGRGAAVRERSVGLLLPAVDGRVAALGEAQRAGALGVEPTPAVRAAVG